MPYYSSTAKLIEITKKSCWNYKLIRIFPPLYFFKNLVGFRYLLTQIQIRKLLIVFNVLKNKAPSNLLDLFQFINDTRSVRTRSSLTDLKLPKVSSEISMLFNSLPNNMKDVENISLQTFKNLLKTYFLDLNTKVSHLEELCCRNCIYNLVRTCNG